VAVEENGMMLHSIVLAHIKQTAKHIFVSLRRNNHMHAIKQSELH
jgi:hypothetical protein